MSQKVKNSLNLFFAVVITIVIFGGIIYLWVLISNKIAEVRKESVAGGQNYYKNAEGIILASTISRNHPLESVYITKEGTKVNLYKDSEKGSELIMELKEIENFINGYFSASGHGEIDLYYRKGDIFIDVFSNNEGIVPVINKSMFRVNLQSKETVEVYNVLYGANKVEDANFVDLKFSKFLMMTFNSSPFVKDEIVYACEDIIFNSNKSMVLENCGSYKVKGYADKESIPEEEDSYLQTAVKYYYYDSEGKPISQISMPPVQGFIYFNFENDGVYEVFKDGKEPVKLPI